MRSSSSRRWRARRCRRGWGRCCPRGNGAASFRAERGREGMFVARNLVDALATIIDYALWAYMWAFILRAVLSWVSPDPYNPIVRGLYAVTEPVLSRLRRQPPLC